MIGSGQVEFSRHHVADVESDGSGLAGEASECMAREFAASEMAST